MSQLLHLHFRVSTLGASAVGTSVVLLPGVGWCDEAGGRSVSDVQSQTVALSVGPVGAAVSSADTPLLTKPVATRAVKKLQILGSLNVCFIHK